MEYNFRSHETTEYIIYRQYINIIVGQLYSIICRSYIEEGTKIESSYELVSNTGT